VATQPCLPFPCQFKGARSSSFSSEGLVISCGNPFTQLSLFRLDLPPRAPPFLTGLPVRKDEEFFMAFFPRVPSFQGLPRSFQFFSCIRSPLFSLSLLFIGVRRAHRNFASDRQNHPSFLCLGRVEPHTLRLEESHLPLSFAKYLVPPVYAWLPDKFFPRISNVPIFSKLS